MRFFVPTIFPGRNEQEKAARQSYHLAAKMKKRFTGISRIYSKQALHRIPWDPGLKYDFVFTWVELTRRRDPDNISAAVKFLFDGFQPHLIAKDSWRHVGSISHLYRLASSKDSAGVMVLVEVSCG